MITTENITLILEVTDYPPPSLKSKISISIPIVRSDIAIYTLSKRVFTIEYPHPISKSNETLTVITLFEPLPMNKDGLYFSLSNNQKGLFKIGLRSAEVTSAASVDCGTYIIGVTLHSTKSILALDKAEIIVNIKGSRKYNLYFNETFRRIQLSNSIRTVNCLSQVVVANTHCRKDVTYNMATLIKGRDSFHITPSGEVCYKKYLDQNIPQRHFYKIVASEKGSKDASVNVLLVRTPSIKDFRVLTKDLLVTIVSLNGSLPSARVVSTFKNDAPYEYYGIIRYNFMSQSVIEDRSIKVDNTTGDIFISEGFFSIHSKIVLEILASVTNQNVPSQIITITFIAGGSKRFSQSLYEFHITLDYVSQIERIVGQVTLDSFSRDSSTVSYYLKESNYREMTFSIDSSRGLIKVKNLHLQDYAISLNVVAEFDGNLKCYSQVLVMIDRVTSPPSFHFTSINVNVWENTAVGTELVQMVPTVSSWMDHYSICYGKYSDWFSIHPKSGQIFLRKELDREETQWAIITVELKNKWGLVKSDMDVNILDNNDNKPSCKDSVVDMTLNDGTALGFVTCPLQCSDVDTLDNGNLTYQIKIITPNTMVSPLTIHFLTGCFEIISSLDMWKANPSGMYTYAVIVSDNGRDVMLSTEVQVNLKVMDTNNHKPYIKSHRVFHVLETISFGREIGRLILEDDDFNNSVVVEVSDKQYGQWFYTDNVEKKEAVLRSRHLKGIEIGSHNFSLKLTDNGHPPQTSYVNVTVIVDDSNDHAPEIIFPQENQNITFTCPILPGFYILKVNARDSDLGYNSKLMYSTADEDSERLFSLHRWTGVITTRVAVPCSQHTRLQIFVSDMGYPRKISSVNFVLSSISNDSYMDLSQIKNINFIIPENAQVGNVLGSLLINPWSILKGVKYLFGGLSPLSSDNVLHIDYDDQRIILLRNDFQFQSKSYPITIILHKANVFPRSFNFDLTIQYYKRKRSWLTSFDKLYVLRVKENQSPGTIVKNFSTKFTENNNVIFDLRQPDNYFILDRFSGVLVTFISLDREQVANEEFFIEIIVSDGGDPNETMVVPVKVLIEDENDNVPIIISPVNTTIEVMVSESRNDSIARVVAVDLDKGRNGQLRYFLHDQDNDMFTVNPDSGYMWIIGMPTSKVYEVNVSVTDCGNSPLISWIILTIILTKGDLENRLRFSSNTISMNLSTSVAGPPSILGRVTLASHSSNSNPDIRFHLIAGKFSTLLEIDSVKGDIRASSQIKLSDIGHAEIIKLSVICYLINEPSNYDIAKLLIHIDHGNNHAPSFAKSKFVVKLPEGEAITDFLTVAANDLDLGVFGKVRYQLIGDIGDKRISIDSNTGRLSCSSLEYMDKKIYNLQVVATDSLGGPRSKNQSAFIEVEVLNTKQQPLEFNSTSFVLSVKENSPRGTVFGNILVHRNPALSKVVYLLNPGHPLINLNLSNGQLEINGLIDREKIQYLDLTIQAISVVADSQKFQTAKASLRIKILDVNDNAPIPSQNPIIIHLSQHIDTTTSLARLSATDPDLDSNITFHFDPDDLTTKTLSTHYHLESLTGILRTNIINFKVGVVQHILKVIISDNGSPARHTRVVVHINMKQRIGLLNVTPEKATFRVMENQSVGAYIGQVHVHGNCSSNKISFTVIDGVHKELVYLHERSGKLFVSSASTIDREQVEEILLWTQVQCLDTNLMGYKNVVIIVDDTDDNRPTFTQKEYVAFVLEGQPPKTTVVRTTIYDPDIGANSQVEYFIESYSPLEEFYIDPEGTVHTNIPLNFHIKSLYKLIIKATSKSTPLLFAECRVTVHIININDQRPIFSSAFQNLQISEDKAVGSLLTTIIAKDSDGPNGISYRIRPRTMQNSTRFLSVAYDSGEIFLSRKIKSSDIGRHEFDIVADDGKYSSSTILEIDVLDVNNQYPILLEDGYDFIVSERMSIGSVLLHLHGSDSDLGVNGEIIFEISPSVSWLGIQDFHNNTAVLYLKSKPYFIAKVQFVGIQLTDKAKDNTKRLTSLSSIILLTESSNPHQPYFLNSTQTNLKIDRSYSLGSKVTSVKCVDEEDEVTYWINNTDSASHLYVDAKTGDVFIKDSLENYLENNLQLEIYCRDNGKPQRKTILYLSINLEKKNKKISNLTFDIGGFKIKTSGESRFPLLVGNLQQKRAPLWMNTLFKLVSATTNDTMSNMTTAAFHVDEMSNIWLIKAIHSKYWDLLLRVNDKDTAKRDLTDLYYSSYVRTTVTVIDNLMTTFDKCDSIGRLTAVIKENESPSVNLINLPILHNAMKYTMDENDNFLLLCNSNFVSNCKLESRTVLDFERNEQYKLSLMATGITSDKQSCSRVLIVLVNVLDVDEYYPTFTQPHYSYSVPGGVPKVGNVLYTVRATDSDSGRFGLVSYQLENNQIIYLAIREDSGDIYVKTEFPTELRSRRKRTTDNKEQKAHERKTFTLNVIASSGDKSSTVIVRLNMLVPYIIEDKNLRGIFISLTEIQIGLIIGIPTFVVILAIIIAVSLILRKRKVKRTDTTYNSSDRSRSYAADYQKSCPTQYQCDLPLPPKSSFNNNYHKTRGSREEGRLPDVTLLSSMHPPNRNILRYSETQEFSFNSDDNFQNLDNRNNSTLSQSSGTSSLKVEDPFTMVYGSEITRNGPPSQFCDSGLGHSKRICNCYTINQNNSRPDNRNNIYDIKSHDSDFSGTSSSCYSAISQKHLPNQHSQSTQFNSTERKQRSINLLRDGPIDHTMIQSARHMPNRAVHSRSSVLLKNDPHSPESMALHNMVPTMHSYIDLRNNNCQSAVPLISPQFTERYYGNNMSFLNYHGCAGNKHMAQVISVDVPNFCAISNPSESSSHHETYAQPYSDVTDIDC